MCADVCCATQALRHIAHHLDEAYLVGLRAMFTALDIENTGTLSIDNIVKALEQQGATVSHCSVLCAFVFLVSMCTLKQQGATVSHCSVPGTMCVHDMCQRHMRLFTWAHALAITQDPECLCGGLTLAVLA